MNRLSTTHPCMFKTEFLREQVDPQVKNMWPNAPFGNLRKLWRERHCAELNPYESRWCPYASEDCALAFLQAVDATVVANPRNGTAYFRTVAHNSAMSRAERKPLAREEGPGHSRDAGRRVETRWGMRRKETHPTGIGEVLGALNLGPRQGQSHDE